MLRRGIHIIVEWELLAVVLLAPLLLFPGRAGGLAMAGVPLLWALRWLDQRHFIRRTPLDWAILLLLAMVAVSFLVTFDLALSLPKITGVVLGVACYYALAARLERPREIWLGIIGFGAVVCAVDIVSLLGTSWFNKIPILGPLAMRLPVAIRGLPGSPPDGFQPNTVAGALIWLLPLMFVLLRRYWSRDLPFQRPELQWLARAALLFTLIIVAGTLILTQSRGGYFGLLCGMLALIIMPHRRLQILAAVIIVAMGVGAIAVGPQVLASYGRLETIQSSQALNTETLQGRFELWSRVVYAIQDMPFTGVGIGTFRRVMPVLYPMYSAEPGFDVGHAHNHLLNAAVDLGIPGLIAYLAIWIGAAVMAYQALRAMLHDDLGRAALGLSGGMVGHFIYSLTDTHALGSKPGLLMWMVFGLVFCLYRAAQARTAVQPEPLALTPTAADVVGLSL